ncbi:hypothetical protein ZIOFF_019327 [Zingiber officinale]|uniref:PHD-type domain-containing protein n=1 Tax=Zingiber officinale TaxID=94328 RepID=A0A8J5H7A6_ZINOF|nr:hypothetical protein ZIOFF_019327 [Zingiber officinale]
MAGGPPESEEFVIRSGVRSGLKREFAFALRSQSQLPASLGRTRSGKSVGGFAASAPRESKKLRESLLSEADEKAVEVAVAPIVVDCDDLGSEGIDVVVRADEDAVETVTLAGSFGGSASEIASSYSKPSAEETLVSLDCCDESAPDDAQANGKPVKASVVHCDDKHKVDVDPSRSGVPVGTLVSVNVQGESAASVKPIKVFVRSPLRGKMGDLLKSANGQAKALGSTVETTIVLDHGATCKLNCSSLDNSRAMGNAVLIDGDDVCNANELASNNQSNSLLALTKGDGVQESILESLPSTATMNSRELLQGTSAVADYGDVHGHSAGLLQKPLRRFTRSMLNSKAPPANREVQTAVLSAMENDKDGRIQDYNFPGLSNGKATRSNIKDRGDDLGTDVSISSESIGLEEIKSEAYSSESLSTPQNKMELKMSKKISLTKLPGNVRELLSTGLLEGLPVKYFTSNGKRIELHGVIKGNGIICSCANCDSSTVVSAYIFEQHAGSTKKHPADFIFLQNGNNLHDVVRACRDAPLNMLEATIQGAIGPTPPRNCFTCQNCSASFSTSRSGKFALFCDLCIESKQHVRTPGPLLGIASSPRLPRTGSKLEPLPRTSFKPGSSTKPEQLPRASSKPEPPSNSSKNLSSIKKTSVGRLTRKDLGLHKLVFMNGILPEGTEVGYYVRGKRLLEGYIKDAGIYCRCCNTVISPSQFEAHAGRAARRKPYNNIYTSNGVSLHELSVSLSKDRKLSAGENDDLCSICADGGNLLLCDLCPRAFHTGCVGLPSIPEGDWHCQYCQNLHQRERSVASNDNAIAAGRVAGVDPIEQIFKRSMCIVTSSQADVGGCAVCRSHDFSKSRFDDRTVMICDQCEKEYHVGCLREQKMAELKELPEGDWFCCSDCIRIWNALQEFLLRGAQKLPVSNADVIMEKLKNKDLNMDTGADMRWRLLSGKTDSGDSKLLLSRAVAIFHVSEVTYKKLIFILDTDAILVYSVGKLESFDPIIEATTGRDLIPSMVYGRTVRDQDFSGMFCAVLTVGSSVVSAGILRVLGSEVAELPLVATSREHQGLGFFQALFFCIETLLASLNVKHFLLPAAEEAEGIWTKKFGFTKINSDQLVKVLKGARTTVFQGTSMLHKPVPLVQSSYSVRQQAAE